MTRKPASADELFLRRAALRLGLQFSAIIFAIIALVGIVAFTLVSASIAESTDRSLTAATHDLRGDEAGAGTYVVTVRDGHLVSSKPLPDGLPDLGAIHDVGTNGGVIDSSVDSGQTSYAVRTLIAGGTVVQVAIDRAESSEEIKRLLVAMAIAGIVGTVAAGVGGYLLSRRAIKPLVESLALQRRFVADASHELRTPLTLLSTRVQLLRRSLLKEGDSRTADEVAEVENDAKALTGILEDLLVAADNRDTGLVAVDLGRLARETASAVAATAAERSLRVTTDISGEAPVVAGIEAPLRRVYLSLLSNALDHATRVVQVHVVGAARTVTIEVADDGPGFPGDARPFERFASDRPDADSARHYGLGLALVADVAARFGGTVEVLAGRPGGVIRIELPRLTREQAAKTTQNSAPSGTS